MGRASLMFDSHREQDRRPECRELWGQAAGVEARSPRNISLNSSKTIENTVVIRQYFALSKAILGLGTGSVSTGLAI